MACSVLVNAARMRLQGAAAAAAAAPMMESLTQMLLQHGWLPARRCSGRPQELKAVVGEGGGILPAGVAFVEPMMKATAVEVVEGLVVRKARQIMAGEELRLAEEVPRLVGEEEELGRLERMAQVCCGMVCGG